MLINERAGYRAVRVPPSPESLAIDPHGFFRLVFLIGAARSYLPIAAIFLRGAHCLPRVPSRGVLSSVARGNIPVFAVTHPLPAPLRKPGRLIPDAVQITREFPVSISTLPSAVEIKSGVIFNGRIWSARDIDSQLPPDVPPRSLAILMVFSTGAPVWPGGIRGVNFVEVRGRLRCTVLGGAVCHSRGAAAWWNLRPRYVVESSGAALPSPKRYGVDPDARQRSTSAMNHLITTHRTTSLPRF